MAARDYPFPWTSKVVKERPVIEHSWPHLFLSSERVRINNRCGAIFQSLMRKKQTKSFKGT